MWFHSAVVEYSFLLSGIKSFALEIADDKLHFPFFLMQFIKMFTQIMLQIYVCISVSLDLAEAAFFLNFLTDAKTAAKMRMLIPIV